MVAPRTGLNEKARTTNPEPVMFTLAVCAEMVFRDLPITERVRRIADLGFDVEIWDWTRHDIDALSRTGATFSSMTGYVTGTLADDAGADELLRTAEQSLLPARGHEPGCVHVRQPDVHDVRLDPAEVAVNPGDLGQALGQ